MDVAVVVMPEEVVVPFTEVPGGNPAIVKEKVVLTEAVTTTSSMIATRVLAVSFDTP